MRHFDEHTIELYVLRSDSVEKQRDEIERHLGECNGCRSLRDAIERFYGQAEVLLSLPPKDQPSIHALGRPVRDIEPYYESFKPVTRDRGQVVSDRLRLVVRRHPVATSMSVIGLAAALTTLLLLRPRETQGDMNPSYAHINPQTSMLEIYNHSRAKLWEVQSREFSQLPGDAIERHLDRVAIVDVDNDGKNEVIAAIDVGHDRLSNRPITVFAPDGEILSTRYFSSALSFRGVPYSEGLSVHDLVVCDYGGVRGKEIFALAENGRSPNILFRLSADFQILGEYVHFGSGSIDTVRFADDQPPNVAFFGQNDTYEPDSLSFPVMIVLNPEKLTGRSEASESRGFNLPSSVAEEFLIRFPLTDLQRELLINASARGASPLMEAGERVLSVEVRGGYSSDTLDNEGAVLFSYHFGDDYAIRRVKYATHSLQFRQNLVRAGKLEDIPIETYLTDLAQGVRYWDGSAWRKEVSRVHHPPQ